MSHTGDRKRKQKLARFGAVLILGFFLLIISLPNLIDLNNHRPQLLSFLKTRFAGEVAIGKLGLTFQHGLGLRVDGVRILDKSGTQHIVVETAIVNFDLSSLLRRHLLLSRLTLVRADIKLHLDEVKSLLKDFLVPVMDSETKPESKKSKFSGWSVDNEIAGALVEIIDSSIEFTDNCFGMSAIKTRLTKLNSTFSWRKSRDFTEFELAAIVLDEAGDGSIAIKGSLSNLKFPLDPGMMILDCKIDAENLNGGTYFPYYQEYVPMRFIGGRVDIDSNYNGSLLGLFRSKGRIVLHQAELDYQQVFRQKLKFEQFSVDYDFRLADSYNTIETRDCTINADGLIVQGYCLLYEARRGIDGTIDAKLSSSEFDPVKVMPVLPWGIIPDEVEQYCNHVQSQGSLVIENAYLKGDYRKITRLLDEQPPSGIIGGYIRGDNLFVSAVKNWPSLTVASINLMLADNLVKMKDVNLSVGDFFICESGKLLLQNIFHDVQVGFSGYLDFNLQKLNPYIDSLFFETAKSRGDTESPFIMNSGHLSGELALQGPLFQLEKMHWGGNFTGRDVGFVLAGLPWEVAHGEGSFVLVDDSLRLDLATMDIASVPWTLQGVLPGPGFFLQESGPVTSGLKLKAMCTNFTPAYLNLLLNKEYDVSGFPTERASSLELDLSSNTRDFSDFSLTGILNVDWRDLECSFTEKPLENLSCSAEFGLDKISFNRLELQSGDSEFTFKGELQEIDENSGYAVSGEISSSYLDVADFSIIDETISEKVQVDQVEIEFNLKGVFDELLLPVEKPVKGAVSNGLWHDLYNFNLSIAGGVHAPVVIKECNWQWGDERSQVDLLGKLQWNDGLSGDIKVSLSDLNVDAILGLPSMQEVLSEEKKSVKKLHSDPVKAVVLEDIAETFNDDIVVSLLSWKDDLARNELNIEVRAHQIRWQHMLLDEIECECSVNDSGVNIGNLAGKSFDGNFSVSAGWDFRDNSFMLESQLDEINFETLNDYLKNPDRGLPMMGGHGSVNLDLYWQGNTLKAWETSLDGELDYDFYAGRLKRFSMIANVCSLLNLSQYASLHLPEISISSGIPYQTLTYEGLIVGGQLEFDEMEMMGSSLNLFGAGVIDLVNDTVDLEFGLQPLQTFDKLLASIPLVGYIMTGDKKTFIVIPVTVRGPYNDLEIKTQTVTGMGKKVGGMVQRFFKTPVRILQMPGKLLNMIGDTQQTDGGGTGNPDEGKVD